MKPFKFSTNVNRKLKEIQKRDASLYNKIQKQLYLFINNPRHTSLRLHKIKRQDGLNIWSISINRSFRMLYEESDFIYFFEIGTHDEVYRKR